MHGKNVEGGRRIARLKAPRLLKSGYGVWSIRRPCPPFQLAGGLLSGVKPDDIGDTDTLDEPALMTVVGGDRKLASELAQLFLDDLDNRVAEINAAVEARQVDRLRAAAHALRGSAGSLRAGNVRDASGALESIASSASLEGAMHALNVLDLALASLRPRLAKMTGRA
jgi:HPt (histidine-containing phosphotransfer) domain-containing protein